MSSCLSEVLGKILISTIVLDFLKTFLGLKNLWNYKIMSFLTHKFLTQQRKKNDFNPKLNNFSLYFQTEFFSHMNMILELQPFKSR